MELPKDLKDEIWEYCRSNDITDLNAFMVRMLRQGYNIEKYGPTPFSMSEKEVIKEVIKEVPVEIIKEVIIEKEVIKEVPIEIEKVIEIIKEVPVEVIKEVFIERTTNDEQKEIVVEKIVEVPIETIKEVIIEKEVIKEVHVENKEKIKTLEQQVENLKIELELEKNRNYQPPKKEKIENQPNTNSLGNVISWVSKTERDDKDIYGE
jgi:hypothetical protein